MRIHVVCLVHCGVKVLLFLHPSTGACAIYLGASKPLIETTMAACRAQVPPFSLGCSMGLKCKV